MRIILANTGRNLPFLNLAPLPGKFGGNSTSFEKTLRASQKYTVVSLLLVPIIVLFVTTIGLTECCCDTIDLELIELTLVYSLINLNL